MTLHSLVSYRQSMILGTYINEVDRAPYLGAILFRVGDHVA